MRRIGLVAAAFAALALGARGSEPFVEGFGGRGVTLNCFVTPQTRIVADFALTATRPCQMRVFGADMEDAGLCASCYVNGKGEFSFGAGDRFTAHPTGVAADTRRHVATLDFAARKATLATGGRIVAERKILVPCTGKGVYPLCALGRAVTRTGRSYGCCAHVRLYSLKVYEDGRLVRDFTPASRAGTGGLWDRLTGFFAENAWRVPHWRPILTAPGALPEAHGHVQGMCYSKDAIYLTMAGGIAKVDWHGRLIAKVPQSVKNVHTGDICLWKNRLYAAICCYPHGPYFGKDPKTGKNLCGCIQVMDLDMNLLKSVPIRRPPDGIVIIDDVLYIGLGSAFTDRKNPYRGTYYGKYDAQTLQPLCEPFVVDCGYDVWMGVQNLTTDGTSIYANYYVPNEVANTPNFIRFDTNFKVLETLHLGYGQGVAFLPGGENGECRFLCCETLNWLNPLHVEKENGIDISALLTFWEVKADGSAKDISIRNGYRVRRER